MSCMCLRSYKRVPLVYRVLIKERNYMPVFVPPASIGSSSYNLTENAELVWHDWVIPYAIMHQPDGIPLVLYSQ